MGKRRVVQLERLRAAYQARGGSWHQLARTAGGSPATLSRLVSARGRARSVSAATPHALAKGLRGPAEWLTGERPDLPYVPQWDFHHPHPARRSPLDPPTAE